MHYETLFQLQKSPIATAYHPGSLLKDDICKIIPGQHNWSGYDTKLTKVFVPFANNADNIWQINAQENYLNQPYEPYTVMYLVIRDYYKEFASLVQGRTVGTFQEYCTIRDRFNFLWLNIQDGNGSGARGEASEGEMIDLGCMFFLLVQSANTQTLKISLSGEFLSDWSKVPYTCKLDVSYEGYSYKLRNTHCSGLDWQLFNMKYMHLTDESTLWLYHLPQMNEEYKQFNWDRVYDLFDLIVQGVNKRKGHIIITAPLQDAEYAQLSSSLGMVSVTNEVKTNGVLFSQRSLPFDEDRYFYLFSNYYSEV